MAKGEIDFRAPAVLRKYPSLNSQRNPDAVYPAPYLLLDGTLDECIQAFMSKPTSIHGLYEIYTRPQPPIVTKVLKGEDIVGLSRLREFL